MRGTGPITVESLSPHRTISAAEKKEQAEVGSDGRTLKTYGLDDGCFSQVPTVSAWGLAVLVLLVLVAAKLGVAGKKAAPRLRADY